MLWFLDLAARAGFRIDGYRDAAEGEMARNADGKEWIARVVLQPHVRFSGALAPDDAMVDGLHHAAHENCFLANSVRSAVETRGSWEYRLGD